MKNFISKCMALTVVIGLLLSLLLALQAQTAQKNEEKKININTASLTELQQLPRIGSTASSKRSKK